MCDGMGGLKNGELASAFVVNAFSNWFENELPEMALAEIDYSRILSRWNMIAQEQGRKIMNYGKARGISLGTTLTAILIIDDKYCYVHVGDSRLYVISENDIRQLTKDQTVLAHEIAQNRLTVEEARTDSRRNILLQCIGASQTITPETGTGAVRENDAFLLCSDGFRHEVSEQEFYGVLAPSLLTSEMVMKKSLVDLVGLNMARNEKDNITALLIKAIR